MLNKKKEYKTTSKIEREFQKLRAYNDLVDRYVYFDNHQRAKEIAFDAQIQAKNAWESVYEIYPDLRGVPIVHKTAEKLIVKK